MQRVAIYDLDRTITRLPTWSRFLVFAARRRAWPRLALIPLVGALALAEAIGLIDRKALKQAMHRLMIGRAISSADMTRLAEAFADRELATNIRADARASIAADRATGYRIVIATAANRFYAAAIASRLGVADLIATDNAVDSIGRILPAIVDDNCYGEAKARAINRWLAETAPGATLIFYSDHISDLPAFLAADEAIAVNPEKRLRSTAKDRGWRIADWR